jgi:hypothetical protein
MVVNAILLDLTLRFCICVDPILITIIWSNPTEALR